MEVKEINFSLYEEVIDEAADLIADFCRAIQCDNSELLRCRLSAEECLLDWLENGCRGNTLKLRFCKRFFNPCFSIECAGSEVNPYREQETSDDYGMFMYGLLTRLGLKPEYSYSGGINRLTFYVHKKVIHPLAFISIMVAAAVAAGMLGMLMPEGWREMILLNFVDPVQTMFYNLLRCIAGPMVFLSVTWGIYGIGDTATLGRIGKRMVLMFTGIVFLAAAVSVIWYPLLGPEIIAAGGTGSDTAAIVQLIVGIIPSSIAEPFVSGNTLQIIFLAVLTGICLLSLSQQAASIARAIEQGNTLIRYAMVGVTRFLPFVIFLIIVNFIWSGNFLILLSAWQCVLVTVLAELFVLLLVLVFIRFVIHVPPLKILKLCLPAGIIALTTASSSASFATCMDICKKKLGTDDFIVDFGLPLGLVICKPGLAVFELILAFYLANKYSVPVSASWIMIAVLISCLVSTAVPPVPGGGFIAFSILLSQLSIPSSALDLAVTLDLLTDFFITSVCVVMIILSLFCISWRFGAVDLSVLRDSK